MMSESKSSETNIPVFGVADPAIQYVSRPAAYAVIMDQKERIASVKGTSGYLPGGGSLSDETPEQTVAREVREELARDVRIICQIGEAVQYFYADGHNYRMEATFFEAEFASEASGAGERELRWLESEELEQSFFHQCHAWATGQI
jgi:8-oxo-dGTP pyrophosphatase MutT (NUDIX family)